MSYKLTERSTSNSCDENFLGSEPCLEPTATKAGSGVGFTSLEPAVSEK